jgi:chromosome segregation ATPase
MASSASPTEASPDHPSDTKQDQKPSQPAGEPAHTDAETTEHDPELPPHSVTIEDLILHIRKVEKENQDLKEDLNDVIKVNDETEEKYELLVGQNAEYYAELQEAKEEIKVLQEEIKYIKKENLELLKDNNYLQKKVDDQICMMCGVEGDSWVKEEQGV